MVQTNFSKSEKDVLHELLNISLGNSSTILSRMLKKKVRSKITNLSYIKKDDFIHRMGGKQNLITIFLRISGDIEGCAINVLSFENALMFVNALNKPLNIQKKKIDEYGVDTLKEYSNLITGAYLSNLSKMMNLDFQFSIPHFSHDETVRIYETVILKNLKDTSLHLSNFQNQLYCESFNFPIYSDLIINILPQSVKKIIASTREKFNL